MKPRSFFSLNQSILPRIGIPFRAWVSGARRRRRAPTAQLRAQLNDVGRLRALVARGLVELDLCVFFFQAEDVIRDRRVVDKEILVRPVGADEAVTLRVVEPLHGS